MLRFPATISQLQFRFLVLWLSISVLLLQAAWCFGVYWLQIEWHFQQETIAFEQSIEKYLAQKVIKTPLQIQQAFTTDAHLMNLKRLALNHQRHGEAMQSIQQFLLPTWLHCSYCFDFLHYCCLPVLYSLLGACFSFIQQPVTAAHKPLPDSFRLLLLLEAALVGIGLGVVASLLASSPPAWRDGSSLFLLALTLGFSYKPLLLRLCQWVLRYWRKSMLA